MQIKSQNKTLHMISNTSILILNWLRTEKLQGPTRFLLKNQAQGLVLKVP